MSRIGRNAPCPCGSGKKYKKCCLPKEQAKQVRQPTYHDHCLEVADSLRNRVLKFAAKAGYNQYVEDAFDIYWRTLEEDLDPPEEMDEAWHMKFLEWYVHDFPIPPDGLPLIKLYLASKPVLPAEEMQVLQDWQDAYISVYQVKEVKPDQGALVEDIFSGEEYFIADVSMSRQTRKWELLTMRKVKVLDEWQASSVASREAPQAQEEIHSLVMEAFRLFKKLDPRKQLPDFLREMGFMLHQRLLTLEANPRQPQIITSSGEELTFWEARYHLADLPAAVSRLRSQEDFAESSWEEDNEGLLGNFTFEWLEKGKSVRKIKRIQGQSVLKGQKADSFFTLGSGQGSARILGSVRLESNRLILEAKGEKRFAIGKERLERVLAGLLQHREDTAKTLEEMLDEYAGAMPEEPPAEIPPEIKQALLKEYLDQHYQKWLDAPLPALNGKTPRKAIKTKEGQRLVEHLLRTIEYHHQTKIEYDTSWIRKELGM
ncbi:MAG: SEC-C metal-binding domain-containing protein [Thermodesulfobacteriota bacterium]